MTWRMCAGCAGAWLETVCGLTQHRALCCAGKPGVTDISWHESNKGKFQLTRAQLESSVPTEIEIAFVAAGDVVAFTDDIRQLVSTERGPHVARG